MRLCFGLNAPSVVVVFYTQVAASNLRFGDGVTAEVGMDLKNMKARKVTMLSFHSFL